MPRWITWLLLTALIACPISTRADPLPAACSVPDSLLNPDEPLAQLGAAIRAGGPVNILAVGSATMVGAELGAGHTTAFPYRMVDALQMALPRITFDLTVRGGRGMTAGDMLPLLRGALATRHYSLVLWQTGTVEAVRGLPPDGMVAALQEGVEPALAAGADVVLIDSQFSRFLRANADLEPYQDALQQVAVLPGVVVFRRFEVMRSWADAGTIDLEHTPRGDRNHAMSLLNTCLGNALARFVLNGAGVPPP
jgi:hypothetical protein